MIIFLFLLNSGLLFFSLKLLLSTTHPYQRLTLMAAIGTNAICDVIALVLLLVPAVTGALGVVGELAPRLLVTLLLFGVGVLLVFAVMRLGSYAKKTAVMFNQVQAAKQRRPQAAPNAPGGRTYVPYNQGATA